MVNPDIIRIARDMLPNRETSITTIAKLLGGSPSTLYNHIPDLKDLRAGCALPRGIEVGPHARAAGRVAVSPSGQTVDAGTVPSSV